MAGLQGDGAGNARIHGNQITVSLDFFVGSNQTPVGPFEHLRDVRFNAAPLRSLHARHHAIAVHYATHLAPVQVNILSAFVIRDEKAVTIRMGVHSAGNQVLAVGQAVMVFLQPNHPAVANQASERVENQLQIAGFEAGAPADFHWSQTEARLAGE
jgi:hypothetical protein